jgi:hypothetical protein
MDTLRQMRTEVKKYIDIAGLKVVKMVHAMLEVEKEGDWWQNEEVLAIVKSRSASRKAGKIAGVPWEKAKAEMLAGVKKKIRK